MDNRRFGKSLKIVLGLLLTIQTSCVFFPQEKPLNPKLLFTVGSSFLNDAKTLALKGDIEFGDGKSAQSGKFTIFINGLDSLALLIEGPLNMDVVRMIVLGDSAYMHTNDRKGWWEFQTWYQFASTGYGIDDLSPKCMGLYVLPQFYLGSRVAEIKSAQEVIEYRDLEIFVMHQPYPDHFFMQTMTKYQQSSIIVDYSRRKDINNGFYPSSININEANHTWQIILHINNLRVNPQIPAQVWERD